MQNNAKRVAVVALAVMLGFGMGLPQDIYAKQGKDESLIEQNFTQEQRNTLKKLKGENREATAELRQALKDKKIELENQLKSATPDKPRIQTLSEEIGALRGKLLCAKVDLRAELKKAGLPENVLDKKDKDLRKKGTPRDKKFRDENRKSGE